MPTNREVAERIVEKIVRALDDARWCSLAVPSIQSIVNSALSTARREAAAEATEQAAKVVEAYDGDGIRDAGEGRPFGNAFAAKEGIANRIRAQSPAPSASGDRESDWPARAIIDGDCISIRVPISALPIAFEAMPPHFGLQDDKGDPLYKVSDPATFADSLCRQLNREEEDGTTPIHIMLDGAMVEVVEQGDEGIDAIERSDDRKGASHDG